LIDPVTEGVHELKIIIVRMQFSDFGPTII
jgi:hypothetical protein